MQVSNFSFQLSYYKLQFIYKIGDRLYLASRVQYIFYECMRRDIGIRFLFFPMRTRNERLVHFSFSCLLETGLITKNRRNSKIVDIYNNNDNSNANRGHGKRKLIPVLGAKDTYE